jgi:hypothetical protein
MFGYTRSVNNVNKPAPASPGRPEETSCVTGETTINLSTGQRLISTSGGAEFVVTKGGEADLTCNGVSLEEKADQSPVAGDGPDIQLGKRYQASGDGVSLLCVKAGKGELACDGNVMELQGARKLPSSD